MTCLVSHLVYLATEICGEMLVLCARVLLLQGFLVLRGAGSSFLILMLSFEYPFLVNEALSFSRDGNRTFKKAFFPF